MEPVVRFHARVASEHDAPGARWVSLHKRLSKESHAQVSNVKASSTKARAVAPLPMRALSIAF